MTTLTTARAWGVLVVEDDPPLLALTGQRLRGMGCRVWLADTEAVAWSTYATEREAMDFVFTDLRLEEGTGRDLVARLIAFDPQAQIVVTSPLWEELDGLRKTWDTRLRYLHKPYAAVDLQALLAVEPRS